MLVVDDEREFIAVLAEPEVEPARPRLRTRLWRACAALARGIASLVEWLFGLLSLVLGLSILAALPIINVLSLGYFLESSARVARSGRIRDGFVGVRKAARVGGSHGGNLAVTRTDLARRDLRPLGRADQSRRPQRNPLARSG